MGAGIAQVALQASLGPVVLFDASAPQRDKALAAIRAGLGKLVEKGRIPAGILDGLGDRLRLASSLDELASCDLVVEAIPEDLALKRDLFTRLEALVAPDAILASNTSSLSITAIAGTTAHPERVVGIHFFNPVPLMALVEVISGIRTSPDVAERAVGLVEALGKKPVRALDTPGFIVNRVARPYYGEALRLLGEGVADHATIDRILTLAAGFRMGPFELMDLIGIDVNFAVTQSVYHAFFEDSRYRPHPIQARMVAAGSLGRKTGRGFYVEPRETEPEAAQPARPPRPERVMVLGPESERVEWAARLRTAGHEVVTAAGDRPEWVVDLFWDREAKRSGLRALAKELPPGTAFLTSVLTVSASEVASWIPDHPRVAGMAWLPTSPEGRLVECARSLSAPVDLETCVSGFCSSLGLQTAWVADRAGLVTPRILACLVNEAASAVMEGVATVADVDRAMQLGVNYPLGPLAWGDRLGLDRVVGVLEGLQHEQGPDRYRPVPLLRQMALLGRRFHEPAAEPVAIAKG
jgi:3-hydroxybutyryl-CoA dehydrogenase